MSTSARYDSMIARLTAAMPELRPRLRDPLACILVGISQAVSALLPGGTKMIVAS